MCVMAEIDKRPVRLGQKAALTTREHASAGNNHMSYVISYYINEYHLAAARGVVGGTSPLLPVNRRAGFLRLAAFACA